LCRIKCDVVVSCRVVVWYVVIYPRKIRIIKATRRLDGSYPSPEVDIRKSERLIDT